MTGRGGHRGFLGAIVALALLAIGSWPYLEAARAIEAAANRRIARAESAVGALVDGSGEVLEVSRAKSRLIVAEGASFRFDAADPIARLRFDVAPSSLVEGLVLRWSDDEAAPRVVVQPGSNWFCSIARSDAIESRTSTGDLPPPSPSADSASVALSLDGRRLHVGIDGAAVVSAECSLTDFRGASLAAEGGAFELLRVDAIAADGTTIARESFDELPAPPSTVPRHVVIHSSVALASAFALLLVVGFAGRRIATILAAGLIVFVASALVAFAIGAIGGSLPERSSRGEPCVPAAIEESLHLHAGNERRLEGSFADFRCELRFATAWNSSLEVAMFGDAREGEDVVVFRLATDPRLRTGFALHENSTGRVRPLGFDIEAFEPNRLLDVSIVSDAGLLRAYAVDVLADDATRERQRMQPVAEAFLPKDIAANGPIVVRAMRGGMRVDRVAVAPLSEPATTPMLIAEPRLTESRARTRIAGGFVLAILLLAAAARSSARIAGPLVATGFACGAVVPALLAAIEPPLALGPFAALVGFAPALVVLLGATIFAAASARSLGRIVGAVIALFVVIGISSVRLDLDPERSPLALGSETDHLGRAYELDLALERHANSRREVAWRRDVSLHGDVLEPRRPGDRKTIVVLGDSRVAGLDATKERRSEFAARLERGMAPGVGARGVSVIDATWPDASATSTLAFLEEVLLAPRGREEARSLSFAPDLALIVLPAEAFLASREAELVRRSERDAFRGVWSAALDDAARVLCADEPKREHAMALAERFARIARAAAAERCRILVVVAPNEGVAHPVPVQLDPSGVVDLFLPGLPAVDAGGPLFRDRDVLSARGRALLADVVARFLRKRVFTGGDG